MLDRSCSFSLLCTAKGLEVAGHALAEDAQSAEHIRSLLQVVLGRDVERRGVDCQAKGKEKRRNVKFEENFTCLNGCGHWANVYPFL